MNEEVRLAVDYLYENDLVIKKIIDEIERIPKDQWKRIRVEAGSGKKRNIKVIDSKIKLKGYGGEIRQIAITGH